MFGDVIGSIYDFFVAKLQAVLDFANNQFQALRKIFDGFIMFIKGIFTGNWEQALNGIKQIASGIFDSIVNKFNFILELLKGKVTLWGTVVGQAFGGAFKGVVNAVLRTIENIINAPIRAINGLINTVNAIPRNKNKQIKYI